MRCARECLDEIVSIYQDGSQENASQLLQKVADLYFLTLEQQSAAERDSFGDVMIRMAQSAGARERAQLAERIARTSPIPIELLRHLAQDEIFIARPILQYSPCLREGDLVAITSEVGQAHLSATAHRNDLTIPVTDILVSRGEPEVHMALAQNVSANLSEESVSRLFRAAESHVDLLDVLNARRDTAPNPIRKLRRLADAEFWHRMAETLLMSEEIVDEKLAPQRAAEESEDEAASEPEPAKAPAVDIFRQTSASKEKALVEAARAGQVVETIETLASITRLDKAMVEHCMFQAHLPALMVLCKAHKLAASTFNSLLQMRENHTETPINDTIGLIRRYEAMTPDTAQRVIRFADKGRPDPEKQSATA